LAIVFCEPIGSFLIDQFAPKLLTTDINDKPQVSVSNEPPKLNEKDLDASVASVDNRDIQVVVDDIDKEKQQPRASVSEVDKNFHDYESPG
jgi:hypothetical protein